MSLNELYELSASEKLYIIEELWNRLDENEVESPTWHKEILDHRKELYEKGEIRLVSIEELKKHR